MDKMILSFNTEIKEFDEKERSLTALVSTATKDRMGEVLIPGGADLKNYNKNPVVLWAHDYSRPPIGKSMWTKRTQEGVLAKVKFASTPFADEIYQLYKGGFMKAFSVGFLPKEWEDGDGEKKPKRTFSKWEMIEFSAVPVPANPDALGLALKSGIQLSDEVKKLFEEELPTVEEAIKSETKSEATTTVVNTDNDEYDDMLITLQEEIKIKDELIDTLAKENAELRSKLFGALQPKPVPEMSVEQIATLCEQQFNRAIRKYTGKLD
jgi:HK97 family phage prohead protease